MEHKDYLEAFKAAAERGENLAPEAIVSHLAQWLASRGEAITSADRPLLIAIGAVLSEIANENQWLRGVDYPSDEALTNATSRKLDKETHRGDANRSPNL